MRFRLLTTALLLACSQGPDTTDGGPDSSTNDASSPDASEAGPTPAEQAAWAQLQTDTMGFLAQSHSPGASIAVVLHGKLAFAAGIGSKNKSGDPVTTATLFDVASMSKMIVAATAMTLVDQGKLDLSAPITTYLPWFTLQAGFDPATVTMERLLSHSASFPCDTISQCGTGTSGTRSSFFMANPQPLWAPAGAIYDYSNTGFALAATVIEAAAGTGDGTYEQLAHDRVLGPAGMTTATFDANAAVLGDHATGYELDGSGNVTSTWELSTLDCPLLHPPGGVRATASDYAHFAEMLLANGGAVLSAASVSNMESPHANMHTFSTQEYGFGLVHQFSPYPDHASVWHNGSLPGFISEMWVIPDDQFAVVALVNARGSVPVADEIVGDALGLFIAEHRSVPPLTTPASQWGGYQGTYNDAYGTLGANLTVAEDAGALFVNAPSSIPPVSGAMTQEAVDTWGMPDGTGATFFPDDAGTVRYFVTRRGVGIKP